MSRIMKRLARSASAMTLFALLNFVVGCSAIANRTLDEVTKRPDRTIPGVVLANVIEGISLSNGEEMKFNEQYGRYNQRKDWISGVTLVGDSAQVSMNDIEWVLVREASIYGPKTVMYDSGSFRQPLNRWKVIDGRSVRLGDTVQFNKAGGRYDAEKQIVTGITEEGELAELEVNEVLYYQYGTTNVGPVIVPVIAAMVVLSVVAMVAWIESSVEEAVRSGSR